MECDSVHSCIERKIKGKDIHVPSDYLHISKEARSKPAPYDVVCMQYTDFKDFTPKKFHRFNSIRPGRVSYCLIINTIKFINWNYVLLKVGNDLVVTDIRALKYLPNEKFFY
ncbi:unnamed protein product [Psylliodes chrysocephalus]|uniref:Uncharacterized protein n=1 Tax=Psylliodes chrysocephalus TaxID=3402493 RepID=A0A9P0D3A7_9CUCU|nr:unnamed protein product [Psylliodes chrysocephala]